MFSRREYRLLTTVLAIETRIFDNLFAGWELRCLHLSTVLT